MDAILPSAGTYKVNVQVNGLSFDECSYVDSSDAIQPFFENSVLDDPDVTGLIITLRDSRGRIFGGRVIYALENEKEADESAGAEPDAEEEQVTERAEGENEGGAENEDADGKEAAAKPQKTKSYKDGIDTVMPVKTLDQDLPFFPIPEKMPQGRYTMVFQVMSGKETLHKTEKTFFYLADVKFAFKDIQIHLPGIAEGPQLIPMGKTIMLEAKLDFDSRCSPYIVWYNGKKIIGEGNYSEGAGNMLWKAPEQSGFLSLRAEAFPVANNRQGMAGYSREIAAPVSLKEFQMHILSEDTPRLLHWYLFEGDLIDSKAAAVPEYALNPAVKKADPLWMPANGTYGLGTGVDAAYMFPDIAISTAGKTGGKFIIRFKPVREGQILSAQFGPFYDVVMDLHTEDGNLVLTLTSPSDTVSQAVVIQEPDSFITAEIDFTTAPKLLTADLTVMGNVVEEDEAESGPITVVVPLALLSPLDGKIKTTLGLQRKAPVSESEADQSAESGNAGKVSNAAQKPVITALWDELAFLTKPVIKIDEEESEKDEPANELVLAAPVQD